MRPVISCLIVLWLLGTPIFGQVPSNAPIAAVSPSNQADHDALQKIEDDWLKGENTTDIAVLERVLADDYVNLTPRGLGPGKTEIVEHLRPRAGQAPPYTLETKNMHIYVLGETAVAAYDEAYIAKENGNVVRENTTHIFTKVQGTWKLRISRASLVVNE